MRLSEADYLLTEAIELANEVTREYPVETFTKILTSLFLLHDKFKLTQKVNNAVIDLIVERKSKFNNWSL